MAPTGNECDCPTERIVWYPDPEIDRLRQENHDLRQKNIDLTLEILAWRTWARNREGSGP